MPELPEVHTIVEDLKKGKFIGVPIGKVEVYWEKTVHAISSVDFIRLLEKTSIQQIERRGKYIVFILANGYFLYIHLRMTGHFLLDSPTSHVRLKIQFQNGTTLYYQDPRKFGRWTIVNDQKVFEKKLGAEPLDPSFTFDWFWSKLQKKTKSLKSLLLDQSFMVGLGNIYVDEALWEASLHPLTRANTLNQSQAKKLYKAIILVLERGIKTGGTTLGKGKSNYYRLNGNKGEHQTLLKVFRRTGEPCFRCKEIIQRLVIAQRGTHICPNCQRMI